MPRRLKIWTYNLLPMKKIFLLFVATFLLSSCAYDEIKVTEPEVMARGSDEVNRSLSLSEVLITDFVYLFGYNPSYGYEVPRCNTSFEVPEKKDIQLSRAGQLVNSGYDIHAFISSDGYAGSVGDVLEVKWYHEKVEYSNDENGDPDLTTRSHVAWEEIAAEENRVVEVACAGKPYAYATIDSKTIEKFYTPLSYIYRAVFILDGQNIGVQEFIIVK